MASSAEIFGDAYRRGLWGRSKEAAAPFYSGAGSHTAALVDPYVAAVRKLLAHFVRKPVVADLGCGDFAVGRRLADLAETYVACDVVPELIAHNRAAHADLANVEFRQLDMARDPLPPADVVLVRQVFQHLSNGAIAAAMRKVIDAYSLAVVTEHLPSGDFSPNLPKGDGPSTRLARGSGVVLTAPPFGLRPLEAYAIADVPSEDGRILSMLYRLK